MQDKFIAITCFQSFEPSVFQPPPQKALQHTLNLANMYHPAECNPLAEDNHVLKGSPDCPKDTRKLFLKDSNNQWRGRRGRGSAHWVSNLNLLAAAVIK